MYRERPAYPEGSVVWSGTGSPDGTVRVLPDGCMDLLLWNGRMVIAGPDSHAHLFRLAPGDSMTGLRFAPGAAPQALGVRAYELRDRRVPLDAVWPEAEVRELEECALASHAPGAVLEAAAARRAAAGAEEPVRRAVLRMLREGNGVTETARAVGLSERQLRRRSLDAFGYGPKTLARVLRMQRALARVREGAPTAEAAARTGYADQAHLAREVRALAGVPLTRLSPPARPPERPWLPR